MSSNLSTEEAGALAAALGGREADRTASVVTRQFDRPLRLSPAELDELRQKARRAARDVARELAGPLRSDVALEIAELSEVNAETLPAQLTPPFLALRFEIDKQPGWLVWDCKTALDAVEVALGAATPGENSVRRLSPVEQSTCLRLMSGAVTRLAAALGLKAASFSLAQDHENLGGWRQGGERAEMQRLCLSFTLTAFERESDWRLYLPGVAPAQRAASKLGPQAPLPAHLGDVEVVLRAQLGGARVPLADLLKIEPGDVIPLDRELGAALELCVEDQPCMRAVLGTSRGKLAVRIHEVQRPRGGA